jgi:hypothetical protein
LGHGKETGVAEAASWDVYKIAKSAVWLGAIEAPDKQAAVEASREFKIEVWHLYAVGSAMSRREGEMRAVLIPVKREAHTLLTI